MKVKFLALAALTLALGTSCDKDDKNELPAATLTGKWVFSKMGVAIGNVEQLNDYDGHEDGCTKDYIEFGANGSFAAVDYDSFNSPCEVFADAGTYAVTGNTIVTNIDGDVTTVNIMNLSFVELKVKDTDTGEILVFTR